MAAQGFPLYIQLPVPAVRPLVVLESSWLYQRANSQPYSPGVGHGDMPILGLSKTLAQRPPSQALHFCLLVGWLVVGFWFLLHGESCSVAQAILKLSVMHLLSLTCWDSAQLPAGFNGECRSPGFWMPSSSIRFFPFLSQVPSSQVLSIKVCSI